MSRGGPVQPSFFHRTGDTPQKTFVFGHSEQIFDSVGLTPAHQRISAEAAVGPNQDFHQRPFVAEQFHQTPQYFQSPVAGVDVGLPQLRPKKIIATESSSYGGRHVRNTPPVRPSPRRSSCSAADCSGGYRRFPDG